MFVDLHTAPWARRRTFHTDHVVNYPSHFLSSIFFSVIFKLFEFHKSPWLPRSNPISKSPSPFVLR